MRWKIASVVAAAAALSSTALAQESVADAAKRVKPKDAQTTSKRVFTDDDVKHSTLTPNTPSNPNDRIEQAQIIVDKLGDKTPRELGEGIVGETRFPGRDVWEKKLSIQRDRLVAAAQVGIDVAKKVVSDASTAEQKANAEHAANDVLWNFGLEKNKYDSLVIEGIAAASAWEKKRSY